jgi:hypothetical protein
MIRWLTLGLIAIGIIGLVLAMHLWSLWIVLIIVGALSYWFTSHRPIIGGEPRDVTLPSVPSSTKGGWGKVTDSRKGENDNDKKLDSDSDGFDIIPAYTPPSTGTIPVPPGKPTSKPMPIESPRAEPAKDRDGLPPMPIPPPPPVTPPSGSPDPAREREEGEIQGTEDKPTLEPEPVLAAGGESPEPADEFEIDLTPPLDDFLKEKPITDG